MEIKTIKEEIINTIIIEKSEFIAYLSSIKDKEDGEKYIEKIRTMHPEATHVCSAMVYIENRNENFKANDDGEPSTTAGQPILKVLKANGLSNVICVVVRYFGGIKLGAGGLIRAYSNSCAAAVKLAQIATMVDCDYFQIVFRYNYVKLMDIALEHLNAIIKNKSFELQVTYEVIFLHKNDINLLLEKFANELVIEKIGSEKVIL